MVKSGCQMCMSWTQVTSLLKPGNVIIFIYHFFIIIFFKIFGEHDQCQICFICHLLLQTVSLEWMQLPVTGSVPPPRCGHTATMVEKRLLIYGGRGEVASLSSHSVNSFCLLYIV